MSKIEGTYELTQFLRRYPMECNKIIKRALTSSMRPVTAAIRRGVPEGRERWKKLVKAKAAQSRTTGRLYVTAGFRDNFKREVEKVAKKTGRTYGIREWTKAYFMNYGTLTRRNPNHRFEYPPRGRHSKNKQGQPAVGFYEKSVEGLETKVRETFVRTIDRQHEKLLNSKIK